MSRRQEKRAVRRDHERRAHDRARQVISGLSTLDRRPASESEVCRRANNLANCSCPLCKKARYNSDGLSRVDRLRLAGQEEE